MTPEEQTAAPTVATIPVHEGESEADAFARAMGWIAPWKEVCHD